jgi:hypothetical protein
MYQHICHILTSMSRNNIMLCEMVKKKTNVSLLRGFIATTTGQPRGPFTFLRIIGFLTC